MIRILFDELANSHSDLFLRIETPTLLLTADSYYISDFLKLPDEVENSTERSITNLKLDAAIEFVKYIQSRILKCNTECFIPFDISDEYIRGLMVKKNKKGFKVKIVLTRSIHGYEIDKDVLDEVIKIRKVSFEADSPLEWLMSEEGILNGLTTSIEKIKSAYS